MLPAAAELEGKKVNKGTEAFSRRWCIQFDKLAPSTKSNYSRGKKDFEVVKLNLQMTSIKVAMTFHWVSETNEN